MTEFNENNTKQIDLINNSISDDNLSRVIKRVRFNDVPKIHLIISKGELLAAGLRNDLWGDPNEKNINMIDGYNELKRCKIIYKFYEKKVSSTDHAVLMMYGIKIWSDNISQNIPINKPICRSNTIKSGLSDLLKLSKHNNYPDTDSCSGSDSGSDSDSDSDINYNRYNSCFGNYGSAWEFQ